MARYADVELPDDLFYDPIDHLWSRVEEGGVRIGLDQFGQKAAGTVAHLKLLPVGKVLKKGRSMGALEAGKFIGPLKAQVAGTIIAVNDAVLANPSLVNTAPYDTWFVLVEPVDAVADLADRISGAEAIATWLEAEYRDYVGKGFFEDPGHDV